jgi:hypothetical protein
MTRAQAGPMLADGSGPPLGAAGLRPPRRLWWMYLLVLLALAVTGGGAAQAWFGDRNARAIAASLACLRSHRVPGLPSTLAAATAVIRPFTECSAGLNHRWGLAMIAGAILVPGVAWILMICGGLAARWRFRRRRDGPPLTSAARGAADRFGEWCDAWELTGHRRPSLRLAAPGRSAGQAFTTGVPFGRPLVVIPLSYAYIDVAAFDAVVVHELAHVRSRDLTWASSVWWAGWLGLPVLLAAISPVLPHPSLLLADYQSSLWLAAVMTPAILLSRAALLRRRELAADHCVAQAMGGIEGLCVALGGRRAGVQVSGRDGPRGTATAGLLARAARGAGAQLRVLAATHPSVGERVRVAAVPPDLWEGGFAVALAAGLLAMAAFQVLDLLVSDLSGLAWAAAPDAALAAASLLWASAIIPAWVRRAAAAARAGAGPSWRGPLSGTIFGIAAGYCVQVPGTELVVGRQVFAGHFLVLLALLVLVVPGVALLAAGTAGGVAVGREGRKYQLLRTGGAIVSAAAALTIALGLMAMIWTAQATWASPAEDRALLMTQADEWQWCGAAALVLIGAAMAMPGRSRPECVAGQRGRGRSGLVLRAWLMVIAAAAAVGGIAAVLCRQLRYRPGLPDDTLYLVQYQRFWICALAGWAAAVILLAEGRGVVRSAARPAGAALANVPAALAAGGLTAILAGAVQSAWPSAAGTGHRLHFLREFARSPVWLLVITMIVTLPWAILAAGATGRLSRLRPARPGIVAAGAGIMVAAISLALVAGATSLLTVGPHDYSLSAAAERRVAAHLTAKAAAGQQGGPESAASPPWAVALGRAVGHAAAVTALAGIGGLLPAGWRPVPPPPPSSDAPPTGISPAECQTMEASDSAAEAALARTAAATRAYTFPALGVSPPGMSLSVSLVSYVGSAPSLAADREQVARCPHLERAASNGPLRVTFSAGPPPVIPGAAYRVDSQFTASVHGRDWRGGTVQDFARIGHIGIDVSVTGVYLGRAHADSIRPSPGGLAAAVLAAIISNMQSRGSTRPAR